MEPYKFYFRYFISGLSLSLFFICFFLSMDSMILFTIYQVLWLMACGFFASLGITCYKVGSHMHIQYLKKKICEDNQNQSNINSFGHSGYSDKSGYSGKKELLKG